MKSTALFISAVIVMLICIAASDVHAQREFIEKGRRATALEIGYLNSDNIDGFALAAGFTSDRELDLGASIGRLEAGSSLEIYSFRIGGEYYIAKSYKKGGRFFMSMGVAFLHDWYRSKRGYDDSNKSYSGIALGPTVSFGPRGEKAQLLISGGIHWLDMATLDEDDHWVKSLGLALAFKRAGSNWLGISSGYSNNDSTDTFSISLLIVAEKL